MKQYKITLENREPFCIRADRADDLISTLDYIPGTTLLGALVYRYLMEYDTDGLFSLYFTENKVYYPNLYPVAEATEGITTGISLPFPKTAKTCKRWEWEHGIVDTLFDWALYNQLKNAGENKIEILKKRESCRVCKKNKQSLTPLSGFYRSHKVPDPIQTCKVEKKIQAHTGINRSTQTVSDGILYNIETVAKHYLFNGILIFSNEIPDESIESFVAWINNKVIHIGTRKTSGLGSCQLRLEPIETNPFDDFKKRLILFDKKYKDFIKADCADNTIDNFYFSLDLISEAIFLDEFLNYKIGFKNLEKELNLPETALLYERVSPFEVYGWNTSARLPRQIEVAVEKGSTAFFQSKMDADSLIHRLYLTEKEGIGIRTGEGFGRILVSSPFHFEQR